MAHRSKCRARPGGSQKNNSPARQRKNAQVNDEILIWVVDHAVFMLSSVLTEVLFYSNI
jgi:hypothetical protein